MKKKLECWVCVDKFKIGTWKQADALAKKWINVYEKKPIQLSGWCCWMPPALFAVLPALLKNLAIKDLGESLPDVIIAAGRQAVLVALALRHKTKTVVLMNPGVSSDYFNLVIAPVHDQLKGNNVIHTQGAIHGIEPENIIFPEHLEKHKAPRVAVLLGGNSAHGTYKDDLAIRLANDLKTMAISNPALRDANFIITPSRRTPLDWLALFEKHLEGLSYWMWNQQSANPYPGLLKGVEVIIVCEDSISMASEACVMGKPVLVYLTGITKPKFKQFYKQLFENQYAQEFNVDAKLTPSPVLKELDRVIEQLTRFDLLK